MQANLSKSYMSWIVTIGLLFMATSCLKDQSEDQKLEEQRLLQEYLETNNITVQPTESGLYYIETLAGSGAQPDSGNSVTVDYTGKLINGNIFDSSQNRGPFTFQISVEQVIAGWEEGIYMMKKGGKATLIIPSDLGYGAYGSYSIPPYATLIFDVELKDIQP